MDYDENRGESNNINNDDFQDAQFEDFILEEEKISVNDNTHKISSRMASAVAVLMVIILAVTWVGIKIGSEEVTSELMPSEEEIQVEINDELKIDEDISNAFENNVERREIVDQEEEKQEIKSQLTSFQSFSGSGADPQPQIERTVTSVNQYVETSEEAAKDKGNKPELMTWEEFSTRYSVATQRWAYRLESVDKRLKNLEGKTIY